MKKSATKQTKPQKKLIPMDSTVYDRRAPANGLEGIIRYYWVIEELDETRKKVQKVVPDGYPEIIIHYADPYMIRLKSDWELQPRHLIAGQIKRHFFLGNTGRSGMIGIKFMPTALTHLFGIRMKDLTGKVAELESHLGDTFATLIGELNEVVDFDEKCRLLNRFFLNFLHENPVKQNKADEALSLILASNGTTTVKELCNALSISTRQLERLFLQYIGLSPKFYSRIIRFSQIFQHIEQGDPFWTDTVYRTGFYDQSHFIRNFKAFTGEEPTEYLFEELNIANFFLNK